MKRSRGKSSGFFLFIYYLLEKSAQDVSYV